MSYILLFVVKRHFPPEGILKSQRNALDIVALIELQERCKSAVILRVVCTHRIGLGSEIEVVTIKFRGKRTVTPLGFPAALAFQPRC